jgi:integrase
MPLTNVACQKAKPDSYPYKMADTGGLYLHVMPNGSRYWRLKYRYLGKEKLLSLGVYPTITLADARARRDQAKIELSNNIDPAVSKQEQKRRAKQNIETTFELVAREWHKLNLPKWTPAYGQDILHRLEMDIFPKIGKLPIADIRPVKVLETLRFIEKRGAFEMARRSKQYLGQIFRYAVITERADRDPTTDLKDAMKPFQHGHFAALEADDLPEFLGAIERNEARLFLQTRNALRLLMLTFVRTSELIEAKWEEFDLEHAQWNIPAERMKMRRPHIVPLSTQAVNILQEQKKLTGQWEWVFPNSIRPKDHMSNCTILRALERLGYKGRMTGHGFRALAMSTIKERLAYRHEVVDRQLAHAPANKVDAAYDRAKFLDERKIMMQKWADYLDGVRQK